MHHQISDERLPFLNMSVPSYVGGLVQSVINDQKFLEEDLCQCGLCINRLEENIEWLEHEQSKTTKEISELQACLDLNPHYRECRSEKELVTEQIARKSGSAAAAICSIFQSMGKEDGNDFASNILGVVACLGTIQTTDLSRVLAKYLGKDQMLAIVCKSSAYAFDLVKYGPDGQVNTAYGLHALAAKLGIPINRQYRVISLENIRAYAGEIHTGFQRILALLDPTLSNGRPPPGYLGYAVNMIDPDIGHWHWKTPSGHGLRETLFYHLFCELQVYENREYMNKASCCITQGAVLLDGGIIRRSGASSVRYWESDIRFPVICSPSQRHFSADTVEIMKQVHEKKQTLQDITDWLKKQRETHREFMNKFWKRHDRYKKFLNEKEPTLLGQCYRDLDLTPD